MSETLQFDVKGMHCPNCPGKIERKISKMDGVTQVTVNLETESGVVTFNRNLTGMDQILNSIQKMGFEAKAT